MTARCVSPVVETVRRLPLLPVQMFAEVRRDHVRVPASGYLQLREADAIVAIAEQTLASRASTLQLARQRFEQELISKLDVRQFEATVADPAAHVADYIRQRSESENALSILPGTPPQSIPRGQVLSDIVKSVTLPDSISGALLAKHRTK